MSGQETLRSQRLARLDDEQVLDVEVLVLRGVEVLLGDEDSLFEEVFVDRAPVGFGNDHLEPDDIKRVASDCEEVEVRTSGGTRVGGGRGDGCVSQGGLSRFTAISRVSDPFRL